MYGRCNLKTTIVEIRKYFKINLPKLYQVSNQYMIDVIKKVS